MGGQTLSIDHRVQRRSPRRARTKAISAAHPGQEELRVAVDLGRRRGMLRDERSLGDAEHEPRERGSSLAVARGLRAKRARRRRGRRRGARARLATGCGTSCPTATALRRRARPRAAPRAESTTRRAVAAVNALVATANARWLAACARSWTVIVALSRAARLSSRGRGGGGSSRATRGVYRPPHHPPSSLSPAHTIYARLSSPARPLVTRCRSDRRDTHPAPFSRPRPPCTFCT